MNAREGYRSGLPHLCDHRILFQEPLEGLVSRGCSFKNGTREKEYPDTFASLWSHLRVELGSIDIAGCYSYRSVTMSITLSLISQLCSKHLLSRSPHSYAHARAHTHAHTLFATLRGKCSLWFYLNDFLVTHPLTPSPTSTTPPLKHHPHLISWQLTLSTVFGLMGEMIWLFKKGKRFPRAESFTSGSGAGPGVGG